MRHAAFFRQSGHLLRLSALILLAVVVGATLAPETGRTTPLCDSLTAGRFDVIYICPAAWRSEVRRLGIHRSQVFFGGYTSIVAPTETLATCFGPGRAGIRAMLHQALQNWSAPPKHVVLVGAYGEFDTTLKIVPTWYIADRTIGFWYATKYLVATDDFYVTAPGSSNNVPVVSIGRIPVWELSGLHNYIDKLINYEYQDIASWKTVALHAIDDRDLDGNSGVLARQRADSLADASVSGRESYFVRSFLYASSEPPSQNRPIIQGWNGGLGFVLGYGTAGNQWRIAQFTESFAGLSPIGGGDSLVSNYKTPVVLAMTCGGSYTSHGSWPQDMPPQNEPTFKCSLHQYLLTVANKGAVSITGPTRAIRETAAYGIAREWLRVHFAQGPAIYGEPGVTLRTVKANLQGTMPGYKNEILSMMTLGDPALRMPLGSNPVVGLGDPVPLERPRDLIARSISAPAREVAFSVDFPEAGPYSFALYDLQGRMIGKRVEVVGAPASRRIVRFEAGSQRSGIYFLQVQGARRIATAKLVLTP